jgi:APA family basic amino acid/polyamine antiporter
VPIFFTYSGWNAAAYVAGEFRNPSRDVPRALIAGTATVTLLYVGVNLATLAVLPGLPSSAANAPVAAASGVLLGSAGSVIVTMLALAALGSSVCAMIITGPRIYEAMAKDGVLPARFAARDGGSPRTAIIAQSAWTSVLVVTGTFGQLVTYTGFAIVVFSALTVVALVVLRRREGAPRTFAVPLYPVLPILYVIATVLIAISSFRYAPGPSLIGLTLIALGIPLRRFARPFTSLSQVQVRPSGDSP